MITPAMISTSQKLFDDARRVIPGGVNSPVRAFRSVGGAPLFIHSAKGAYVYDEDGNRYLDFVGSWGPMILGHADDEVLAEVTTALNRGCSFGAPTRAETELAQIIVSLIPGVDMIRMVNSGTEATMTAVRLARAVTGRDKFLKFNGCYHGHADCFLIAAGSGTLDIGEPDSPGVPVSVAADTIVARFNDIQSVKEVFAEYGETIAAVIVEPVGGNAGCIPPTDTFLADLRLVCDESGSLLIFDEVMTGFRVARAGAIERYGVQPDLVTFGKIIGGGFPVGAYAGSRFLMEHIAPAGAVYQAGTLSGNPVAVAAGIATLKRLDDELYAYLEKLGGIIETRISEAVNRFQIPVCIQRVGSMFSLFFTEGPVMRVEDTADLDVARFKQFFHAMLNDGYYLAPSPYECSFLGASHTEEQINAFCDRTVFHLQRLYA